MLNLELVHISPLPNWLVCPEQMSCRSDLSQKQCRRGDLSQRRSDQSRRRVAAICRIVCLGLKLFVGQVSSDTSVSRAATNVGWHVDPVMVDTLADILTGTKLTCRLIVSANLSPQWEMREPMLATVRFPIVHALTTSACHMCCTLSCETFAHNQIFLVIYFRWIMHLNCGFY